ncbi:MAG: efflux RND transporter periplasmic adaptor subunit [Myxococcales bacterium]|nr:efflux RND transporter periplasmic adaptor subunit [Myxococcales bacterium]
MRPQPFSTRSFVPVLLFLLGAGCRPKVVDEAPPPALPAVSVTTTTVVDRAMPRFLVLTGSLTPNESSDVAANASGAVLDTFVERGSMVDKGFVLARLDARNAALGAAEASAVLGQAKAQLEVAQTECARVEKLYQAGALSGLEYDKQHGACTTALWAAKTAEARVATASKGLVDASVRAPFAGMIAERYVTAGEYVQPSSKVARVVAIDPLRLEIIVPEASVSLVKVGLAVEFTVATFPKEVFKGSIRYIGPSLQVGSRSLMVEAVAPNADKRLRPGMFARARLALGDVEAPVVPTNAIVVDGNLRRAFFVVEGRIEERLLRLGAERDGFFAVDEGAKKGDKVVAPVTPDVRDGAKVK